MRAYKCDTSADATLSPFNVLGKSTACEVLKNMQISGAGFLMPRYRLRAVTFVFMHIGNSLVLLLLEPFRQTFTAAPPAAFRYTRQRMVSFARISN